NKGNPLVDSGAERRVSGRLAGRTAVVTGAARGIGRATAERLFAEGAGVLLCDVDAGVAAAAAELRQPHFVGDVAQGDIVEALFAAADRELGPTDILVNSAGVIGRAFPLMELPPAEFDRVMRVNLNAGLLTTQAAARR